jgi:hypothetical protein
MYCVIIDSHLQIPLNNGSVMANGRLHDNDKIHFIRPLHHMIWCDECADKFCFQFAISYENDFIYYLFHFASCNKAHRNRKNKKQTGSRSTTINKKNYLVTAMTDKHEISVTHNCNKAGNQNSTSIQDAQ